MKTWNAYYDALKPIEGNGRIEFQTIPEGCEHNAHMFYIKLKDLDDRTVFISYMKKKSIGCVFHYVPLHSAPAGIKFGRMDKDEYTTKESERLVRLPMYYGMTDDERTSVIENVLEYLKR